MANCVSTAAYTLTLTEEEAKALHAVLGELRSMEFEHSELEATLHPVYNALSDAGVASDDAHYSIDIDGDLRFSY